MPHRERHLIERISWLRAAVLGANDGILSTGSIVVGVAAAQSDKLQILVAGLAGLVAGAMSIAAGEYVSVSSQSDTERADLAKEAAELRDTPEEELEELAEIYVARGVEPDIARTVAKQMMRHDALGAHARDELGLSEVLTARPLQAAITSGLTFTSGALLPLIAAIVTPTGWTSWAVSIASIAALGALGSLAAIAGGASVAKSAWRIMFWGIAAMGLTATVGTVFRVTV